MELEHFDKCFVKNTRKKTVQGKILELFPLDTLKTTFWMEDSTQGWTQLGSFVVWIRIDNKYKDRDFEFQFWLQLRFCTSSILPAYQAIGLINYRSIRSQMFFKIGILQNFANFTGKNLCWSLFNEVVGPQACNLIKKRLQHKCFPVKFAKILRTPFLQNTSGGCLWNWNDRLQLIYDGNAYHIETSPLICSALQINGLFSIWCRDLRHKRVNSNSGF